MGAVEKFTEGVPSALPCPNDTTGAPAAAAFASKPSRFVKWNMPAMILPGKVWMALL